MVIHTDDLPFKIEFIVFGRTETDIKDVFQVKKFDTNKNLDFVDDVELFEYNSISVRFSDNKNSSNARLYMDCFNFIDEITDSLELDENEVEYLGINKEIMIHRHFNNDVGFPLIPGVYKIQVNYEEQKYYSQFIIQPNNLTVNEYEIMIKEIEAHAKGLARDWIKKNNSLDILSEINTIDPTYIDKAAILVKKQSAIKNALHVILNSPYTELEKKYELIPIAKNRKMDVKSQKLSQLKNSSSLYGRVASSEGEIYTFSMNSQISNSVNFNLVNIIKEFMVKINFANRDLINIERFVNEEISILLKYKQSENIGYETKLAMRQKQLLNIREFKSSLNNLNLLFIKVLNTSFLKDIKTFNKVPFSQQFFKTPGYNVFYQIRNLVNGKISNKVIDLYDYSWKSSEVLYEYWSFIKIIEMLLELKFIPLEGWIYDSPQDINEIAIPSIADDTYIVFQRGDILIKFIFNSEIGKTPEKAINKQSPYWIRSSRNKPDFRIDIYEKEEFLKTIILDSKYSPANRVWNKNIANASKQSKVVEQFKMYVNMVIKVNTRNQHVVEEVIGLCPTKINKTTLETDHDHLVTIATLKPGLKNDLLLERLNNLIGGSNK
ncbi:nuclease domain-containing protein [Solibacillus ferritrahens]|uniref:nuclease domain-containing protein n=1 Tax=Solibacillus ferritrahens TaxID=3098620 RepID=UPI003009BE74